MNIQSLLGLIALILAVMLYSAPAVAETIPASLTESKVSDTIQAWADWDHASTGPWTYGSVNSACIASCPQQAVYAQSINYPGAACTGFLYFDYTRRICVGTRADNRYPTSDYFGESRVNQCPHGQLQKSDGCYQVSYSCPSSGGWTLSSNQQTCSRPDCPAGYTRDSVTGACQEPCPEGYTRNPNTGACLAPCPSGYVRNLSTMQCEIVCSSPLVRTPANTCDCPSPLTLIDGNTCIGRDDKDTGENCSQGSPDKWP